MPSEVGALLRLTVDLWAWSGLGAWPVPVRSSRGRSSCPYAPAGFVWGCRWEAPHGNLEAEWGLARVRDEGPGVYALPVRGGVSLSVQP